MTPRKKLEAIRRRRVHLDERITAHDHEYEVPDRNDLSYDRSERRALLDAEELFDAMIVPQEGDKLVSRRRYGGMEVLLVLNGEELGRVLVCRSGRNLRVSYTDGVICGPLDAALERTAS